MTRPRHLLTIIALSWTFLPCAVAAQAQQNQVPDQTTENWGAPEIVEVQAKPGPAVWHLTRGDSEVWILGTVGAMPDGLKWNKDYLAELLDGARAILMPPRPSIGLFEGAWFLITNGSKFNLPRGQSLEATLPADIEPRFASLREKLDKNVDHYRTDTALRASLRIQEDVTDKLDLSRDEPRDTIRKLARHKHVPAAPIAKYEVLDAARDVLKLTPAQQQVCLGQSVEDANWDLSHASEAADAWAVGESQLRRVHLADCVIAAVHSVADISERDVADYTAAINDALGKSGKTVAVI